MSRQSGVELGLLRYRTLSCFSVPSAIELQGDMLSWTSTAWRMPKGRQPVSAQGYLRAISKLASGTPPGVLRFAERYGVLALDPLVEEEGDGDQLYLRYTESVLVYTRVGAIVRRLLAVLDHLAHGQTLTKKSRCPVPDHPEMIEPTRIEMAGAYELLNSEDFSAAEMRIALAGIVGDLWEASPPRLTTGKGAEELFGLCVQFASQPAASSHWDQRRIEDAQYYHNLVTALPGQWFFVGAGQEELFRNQCPKRLVSYREYTETFAALLPFMEETRPSPLLSLLAFQLMEAITLPEDTFYCKQCGSEFQPAPGKNAPRKDHGGCCSDECAVLWKRAYNKRHYQRRGY